MNFIYYKQQTGWSCGPAAMRMALASCEIKKSEQQLIKLLNTTNRNGTNHTHFPKLAKKLQLTYTVGKKESTLKQLKKTLEKDFQTIVCYFDHEDGFGHYAVVRKITKTRIYLLDPIKGPNFSLHIKQFLKDWYGKHTYRGWYFGLKK